MIEIIILIFLLVWIFAGLAAFFASIMCLFYNSSDGDKIIGLLLSLFTGPFYWLFYIYKTSYCTL
jgi:hypothetical protein